MCAAKTSNYYVSIIFFRYNYNEGVDHLLPNMVCNKVAIPLIKKMVLMSFPLTTSSFMHSGETRTKGMVIFEPNIVR